MMKRLWSWVAALSCMSELAAAAAPAAAEAAAPMALAAQPLTHVRDGRVQGCGLRLTGGEAARTASSWFDVSVNVFGAGSLVHAIVYELKPSEDGEARPARVPVRSTWISAGEGSTRRGENFERSDALVYRLLTEHALTLFQALAEGRNITVGIRRWGEVEDRVHTGAPVLDERERTEIGACLGRLSSD